MAHDRKLAYAGTVLGLLCFARTAAAADPVSSLLPAIEAGRPNLDVRLRYENVDQDDFEEDAHSFTARVRLGYTSGRWNGVDGQLELEAVHSIADDDFNSTENLRTRFPVVADPEVEEINQAWIAYSGLPGTVLRFGRQRMLFDNQRFIGNVGFRQNEQTYDAFTLSSSRLLPRTVLDYGYISGVNAFLFFDFDPSPESVRLDDDLDIRAHYLRAAVTVIDKKLSLTPYALLLDFDEVPAPARARMDTRTLGLRVAGSLPLAPLSLSYTLEYADQQDYQDSGGSVDADYLLMEAGLARENLKGLLSYEVLGGDGSYSFQTPLATLYAFQGLADQFLVTPAAGVRDLSLSFIASLAKTTLTVAYHDFRADQGGVDFGNEIDLVAVLPVARNLLLGAKYAVYWADEFPVNATSGETFDTTKSWVFAEYRF